MKRIAITSKRHAKGNEKIFRSVYSYLIKVGKEVYVEKQIAEQIGLKEYKEYVRGKTGVDLILVMGGDGTILSVVQRLKKLNTRIFGINMGTLGFMSEIPPVQINKTLDKIFVGHFTVDERPMLRVEIERKGKIIKKYHALNEAVISQATLARLIHLRTRVNDRKLTTYEADGLIIATPTGSTAYSLSAGGPIVYPSMNAFIITPICANTFTQKPIVIPDSKQIEIVVETDYKRINLTIDGQESKALQYKDHIRITRDGSIQFVRLPNESFFSTLREKLNWGEK
ncbi:NAD(+) kinase [Candidatus Peregrinibacteria bacterium CG_4_10_14_0_2_um_filter_43_11]|nr:MAG: NAD(+) kinase [Candidatus Peregrinibacteria bacterium CG_4_10_14_0_2_um_filter_43_11]